MCTKQHHGDICTGIRVFSFKKEILCGEENFRVPAISIANRTDRILYITDHVQIFIEVNSPENTPNYDTSKAEVRNTKQ
jgi:hypothetical protein